jgi:hypothetical protein
MEVLALPIALPGKSSYHIFPYQAKELLFVRPSSTPSLSFVRIPGRRKTSLPCLPSSCPPLNPPLLPEICLMICFYLRWKRSLIA